MYAGLVVVWLASLLPICASEKEEPDFTHEVLLKRFKRTFFEDILNNLSQLFKKTSNVKTDNQADISKSDLTLFLATEPLLKSPELRTTQDTAFSKAPICNSTSDVHTNSSCIIAPMLAAKDCASGSEGNSSCSSIHGSVSVSSVFQSRSITLQKLIPQPSASSHQNHFYERTHHVNNPSVTVHITAATSSNDTASLQQSSSVHNPTETFLPKRTVDREAEFFLADHQRSGYGYSNVLVPISSGLCGASFVVIALMLYQCLRRRSRRRRYFNKNPGERFFGVTHTNLLSDSSDEEFH